MFNFTIDLKFVNENITYLMGKIKKKTEKFDST